MADKNLYCLISPVSFSCGNLVPAGLKSSQKVTLIGRTSGGGSCSVQPMTTAYGTVFQISSAMRMSSAKALAVMATMGMEATALISTSAVAVTEM